VQALEVLNHNAHWIPAPPIPNTLVVNVGGFLERATNDHFQSTVHRVINRTGDERYSIPFFFNPSHKAVIEVVPTCITEEKPAQYESLKAGEWQ
jgi:isopenicillin N synthase-like dioxygenase